MAAEPNHPTAGAMKPIEIFKAGTHTDMAGITRTFAAADLAASAAAYDPALYEAPIVVGHPKIDAPAYGWVGGLEVAQGALVADARQIEPAFAEAVQAGRYKKISAAFYPPDGKTNPAPGVWYLRHVGFLGAAAPAVKGLRPVGFADDDEGIVTVEFSAAADNIVAAAFRRLRDWLIASKGLDTADQVIPNFTIDALNQEAAAEAATPAAPGFSESKQANPKPIAETHEEADVPGPTPTPTPTTETDLAARHAALESATAAFAEEQAAFAAERRRAAAGAVLDRLIAEGKVLPAERDPLAAFMAGLGDTDAVAFGEGDKATPAAFFAAFLKALPNRVEFAELAAGEDPGAGTPRAAAFAAPPGYEVDAEGLALHDKAVAYRAAHPDTSFAAALTAVGA